MLMPLTRVQVQAINIIKMVAIVWNMLLFFSSSFHCPHWTDIDQSFKAIPSPLSKKVRLGFRILVTTCPVQRLYWSFEIWRDQSNCHQQQSTKHSHLILTVAIAQIIHPTWPPWMITLHFFISPTFSLFLSPTTKTKNGSSLRKWHPRKAATHAHLMNCILYSQGGK